MPLDPNIILSAQPVQIQNPLDMMTKMMTMKHLAQQSDIEGVRAQQEKIQLGDQMAMRDAMKNNLVTNPDGSQTINRQGVISDLNRQNPSLAMKTNAEFAQNDIDVMARQTSAMKQLAFSVPTDPTVSLQDKQAAWDQMRSKASQLGLPNVDKLPPQYPGDDAAKAIQTRTLGSEEQLKQQQLGIQNKNEATKIGIEQKNSDLKAQEVAQGSQKIGIEKQRLDVDQKKFEQGKQQGAMQNAMGLLNSGRQTPDVKQAYLDRYTAQKFLDGTKGDPNKISPNMVALYSGEIAKIAQGGAPTEQDMKNVTPDDAKLVQAKAMQYLASHPEAGQQGAFINAFRDYAKTIQSRANMVIHSKIGAVVESYKPWLSETDYNNLKTNYLEGTPEDVAPSAPVDHASAALAALAKRGIK